MCDYCDYPVTDRRNPDYGKRKATPEAETGGELRLRVQLSEVLVKWNMPTRQVAISEMLDLIAAHIRRAVLLGKLEELDRLTAYDKVDTEILAEVRRRIKELQNAITD